LSTRADAGSLETLKKAQPATVANGAMAGDLCGQAADGGVGDSRRSDVEVLTFSGTANRRLMTRDGEEFTSAMSDQTGDSLASL
jgi:hypothetical protein